MRIISGTLGGRLFDAPRGHRTHPMSEKARGALFSSLGDISGAVVLDAYAGSGGLSFEAISRGASQAYAVDSDLTAVKTMHANVEKLGLENAKVSRATISGWAKRHRNMRFDLIFVDPPYRSMEPINFKLIASLLTETGRLIVSWPGKEPAPRIAGLYVTKVKPQGDAQVIFYDFVD